MATVRLSLLLLFPMILGSTPVTGYDGTPTTGNNQTELLSWQGLGTPYRPLTKFEFDKIMPYFIPGFLLLIAMIVQLVWEYPIPLGRGGRTLILDQHIPKVTALYFLGCVVGLLVPFEGVSGQYTYLNKDAVQFMYLPIIVLYAALTVHIPAFTKNLPTIALFAGGGTIMSTVTLASVLYLIAGHTHNPGLTVTQSLTYANIISAVDPVAVLSVFENQGINRELYTIVASEALLNDGVVVAFNQAYAHITEMGQDRLLDFWLSLGYAGLGFIYTLLGSLAVGLLCGWILGLLCNCSEANKLLKICFFLITNYLVYVLAEFTHLSGILVLFTSVLVHRKLFPQQLDYNNTKGLHSLFEWSSQYVEGVMCLKMGLSSFDPKQSLIKHTNLSFASGLIISTYFTRFLVTFTLGSLANVWRREQLSIQSLFLQSHAGLRGAVSFCLVLGLEKEVFPKQLLVTSTAMMVLFSAFLSITIKPLVKCLRIPLTSSYLNIDAPKVASSHCADEPCTQLTEFQTDQISESCENIVILVDQERKCCLIAIEMTQAQ